MRPLQPHESTDALRIRDHIAVGQKDALSCTYPIYGRAHGRIRLLGSGFILRVDKTVVVVTAAHVLHQRLHATLVLPHFDSLPKELQIIEGDSNGADLGLILLPNGVVPDPKRVKPVTLSDFGFSSKIDSDTMYCVTGFPLSRNKQKPHGRFRPAPLAYTASAAEDEVYQSLGRDPEAFLALRYDKRRALDVNLRYVNPLEPTGISGGPVWNLGLFNELVDRPCGRTIAAIAIEQHPSLGAMLAVRNTVLMEFLRRNASELTVDGEPA